MKIYLVVVHEIHIIIQLFVKTYMGLYEYFFVTSLQDRYKLICGLHVYEKLNDKSTDAEIFGGGRSLLEDSTIDSIVSLCVSLNFIYTLLKALANNFAWR